MPKFRVYAVVSGGKYLGTFEAENAKEACEKAENDDDGISLCCQCSSEIEDPQIVETTAILVEGDEEEETNEDIRT